MARLDWRDATCWLPAQTEGLASLLQLESADLDEAAWGLTSDGRLLRGPAAILASIDALLPGGAPLASLLLTLPGVPLTADAVYGWVARNRARLPGSPACRAGQSLPGPEAVTRDEIARRLAHSGGAEHVRRHDVSAKGD